MEIKLFEIRDWGTCIPALAVRVSGDDGPLARRAGYGSGKCVLLTHLGGGNRCEFDPYAWGGRTYPVVHNYIIVHWDDLVSGQVIDVRVILGEAEHPAASDCQ